MYTPAIGYGDVDVDGMALVKLDQETLNKFVAIDFSWFTAANGVLAMNGLKPMHIEIDWPVSVYSGAKPADENDEGCNTICDWWIAEMEDYVFGHNYCRYIRTEELPSFVAMNYDKSRNRLIYNGAKFFWEIETTGDVYGYLQTVPFTLEEMRKAMHALDAMTDACHVEVRNGEVITL
jgi:hypothetical protein